MNRAAFLLTLAFIGLFPPSVKPVRAEAQVAWTLTRPAASFDRNGLTNPANAQKIKAGGTLSGGKGDWGFTGWVEYDVALPRSGWYELTLRGNAHEVQYLFDPDPISSKAAYSVYGSTGNSLTADKIGNFWLTAGRHVLRLQRYFWTGLPAIESFTLTAGTGALAKSIHVETGSPTGLFRVNECAPLQILFGGPVLPATLHLWFKDATGKLLRLDTLPVPLGAAPKKIRIGLPCESPGLYTIQFGENGKAIIYGDVHTVTYEVFDASRTQWEATRTEPATLARTLVEEIDCVRTAPDYYGGGATRTTTSPAGTYRESENVGFTPYQRVPDATTRKALPEPSWFAYRLHGLVPQQPYVVEVDYPDDRLRTFAIALRESAPLSYPVAGGVDSGGEFTVSGTMQTETLLFWPRADGTRVTLMNAHDGRRAAAAKIRVYHVDAPLPPLFTGGKAGRQFLNWYEEGSNFLSMYGAADEQVPGQRAASARWAEAARYAGATVLAPTVVIYNFALYPSRYNVMFSKPDTDYLRRLLLVAEKQGLKVLPELHPRADELTWSATTNTDLASRLLVSKDGKTSTSLPPLFNPIHPANQDWYVGMIGELADTYRDSPALLGVNLRLAQWVNPALNNFHSLDWGYDDYTVGLFAKETGSAVPLGAAGDDTRFAARYRWLMANARARWIDWRCGKIAALYVRIRDRVQQARPDLKVYSSVFLWNAADGQRDALLGAGIDPALLGTIPGVELVNALHAYGRKEADILATQPARDALMDPANLTLLAPAGAPGQFLAGANYIESTEAVVPPLQLGFPAQTKLTWTSATANPAGRHQLERFAVQLAETDAAILGDGGNAYSLGQPVLREFLAEYLRLPAVAFRRRVDATDPVAVWEQATGGNFVFYAVNRERYPVTVSFTLSAGAQPLRLIDGTPAAVQGNVLLVELKPYQLIAYRAAGTAKIVQVAMHVPDTQRTRVNQQVAWLQAFDAAAASAGRLDATEKARVHQAAAEAAAALAQGHLWLARTGVERAPLLAIYRKLNRFPPQFHQDQ